MHKNLSSNLKMKFIYQIQTLKNKNLTYHIAEIYLKWVWAREKDKSKQRPVG